MRRLGLNQFRGWRAALLWEAVIIGGIAFPLEAEEAKPAATVQPPNVRAAIRAILRETFPYDPSVRQKMLETKNASAEGIVQLAPVLVTESRNDPNFGRYLEQRKQNDEAAKPSLTRGAALSLTPAVNLGVIPYQDPIPFGTPIPRWTLLNIRF